MYFPLWWVIFGNNQLTVLFPDCSLCFHSYLSTFWRRIHLKCRSNSVLLLLTKHQALPITKSNLKSLLWSVYTIHALVPDHFSNLVSYHPLCSLCFSCAGVVLQVESSLLVHFGSHCQACSSPRHSLTSFRSLSSHSSPLPYFIFCFNEHLPLPNHILFCLLSPLHQNRD